VVRFEHVGLRYGLGPEVLRDLTFRIDERSFQFLTGPSGAGKTSLLRLLFLSLRPTRGLVTLFGHDIATLSKDALATLRRRIGIVFQDFRLLDHMTTFENVALPLRVIGQAEDSYREEVVELLNWVGLGDRISALPPVLSGGEKQRAAIARAVIARPQLLLADEPTGNVDPNLAKRLLRLFVELNKSGTSVVIAPPGVAVMDRFGARRLVLPEGRLHVYDGRDDENGPTPRARPAGCPFVPAATALRDADRAAGNNFRARPGRSRGHHDFSGLADDGRGPARACRRERMASRRGAGGHDSDPSGGRPRHRDGGGQSRRHHPRLCRHRRGATLFQGRTRAPARAVAGKRTSAR